MMWAATVGNVTIDEAHVVPISAMQFEYGATSCAYSVVHLMSGTPSRSVRERMVCSESACQVVCWMQEWYVTNLRPGQSCAAFGRSAGWPSTGSGGPGASPLWTQMLLKPG